ncbi:hypothetical protein QFW96_00330 [Saccharopolyspora sp. TS4A08]|uniref:NADH-quinone oxidoreductase subunit L n=1 Tax=Saccharopolyspora ipomoeae TaxID=3042027 RepID=A0ABT6PGB4_9PSEU|nr:hypothetical protein [Saccharopolyspora sp. TS4A08]MDI2027028.1 hypothetical protein [Saccharopolyspora sp. TS4A08]
MAPLDLLCALLIPLSVVVGTAAAMSGRRILAQRLAVTSGALAVAGLALVSAISLFGL